MARSAKALDAGAQAVDAPGSTRGLWPPARECAIGSPRMARETVPVLIARGGSEASQIAVRHAADLFAGRPAIVATV